MTKYNWVAKNDNGTQRIDVRASEYEHGDGAKKMVALLQVEGSMMFTFTMTPGQAREMAMALIAAAESLA